MHKGFKFFPPSMLMRKKLNNEHIYTVFLYVYSVSYLIHTVVLVLHMNSLEYGRKSIYKYSILPPNF